MFNKLRTATENACKRIMRKVCDIALREKPKAIAGAEKVKRYVRKSIIDEKVTTSIDENNREVIVIDNRIKAKTIGIVAGVIFLASVVSLGIGARIGARNVYRTTSMALNKLREQGICCIMYGDTCTLIHANLINFLLGGKND